mgnify:CR=1 FL=1
MPSHTTFISGIFVDTWESSHWSHLLDECEIKLGESAETYHQSVCEHLKESSGNIGLKQDMLEKLMGGTDEWTREDKQLYLYEQVE